MFSNFLGKVFSFAGSEILKVVSILEKFGSPAK